MKYQKDIGEISSLSITETNVAAMQMDESETVTVQLANDEEATKLIAEFEDPDGELAHEEGSIMGKYEAFHQFRC